MKIFKILAVASLTIAVCAVSVSCKKDKDGEPQPVISMKWNGKEFPIDAAQNWYNLGTVRDVFFFGTGNPLSPVVHSNQLHFYTDIPTAWTNGYKLWTSVTSASYKVRIRTGDLDILIPSPAGTPNPPVITDGYIAVTGGNSGYDITVTMTVRYFDPNLHANTTGKLEIFYKGKMTYNEDLKTYLEDEEEEEEW